LEEFVIVHLCDKIFLSHLGIVADPSKTTHLAHSEIQIFNGISFDIFLVLAYTTIFAALGETFMVISFSQSKIH
jgi:hypothetical protein